MANLNYKSKICNTKHILPYPSFQSFCFLKKKNYDQKQMEHIMLNEQCKAMHDNAQLSYKGYTNKKCQFLN